MKPATNRIPALFLGVLSLVVLLVSGALIRTRPSVARPEPAPFVLPVVTVKTVAMAQATPVITARGEIRARYETTLTAEVAGRILFLAENFEVGQTVHKGTVLARVEDATYRKNVATARNLLATARVSLLEEERKSEQARREWEASGLAGDPTSPLLLRTPQLEAARAAVESAKADLEAARTDLERTEIRAPFDAVIVTRNISPGNHLESGATVATLYSQNQLQLRVSLSRRKSDLLPAESVLSQGNRPVGVFTDAGKWEGRIRSMDGFTSTETRERCLTIDLVSASGSDPLPTPGTFAEARLSGRVMKGGLSLPETSLSTSGHIWFVENGILRRAAARPIFREAGRIYIEPPEGKTTLQVLIHPQSSLTPGVKVSTRSASAS